MHDGLETRRTRREPDEVRVEDVLHGDLLEDELVDREYLSEVFREPRKYLPPPRVRQPREVPEDRGAPESVLARRSRMVGLLVAIAMLAGAIVAAALLADDRTDQPAEKSSPVRDMSGIKALRGFTVPDPAATVAGPAHPRPTADSESVDTGSVDVDSVDEQASTTHPTTRTHRQHAQAPTTHGRLDDSETPRSATADTQSTEAVTESPRQDKVGTVREFYRLLGTDPADAATLLGTGLSLGQAGALLRGWESVDDVRLLEASLRPDGSVLAVVRMLGPAGEPMRVTQLVTLGEDQRINAVRLLSAQHT